MIKSSSKTYMNKLFLKCIFLTYTCVKLEVVALRISTWYKKYTIAIVDIFEFKYFFI